MSPLNAERRARPRATRAGSSGPRRIRTSGLPTSESGSPARTRATRRAAAHPSPRFPRRTPTNRAAASGTSAAVARKPSRENGRFRALAPRNCRWPCACALGARQTRPARLRRFQAARSPRRARERRWPGERSSRCRTRCSRSASSQVTRIPAVSLEYRVPSSAALRALGAGVMAHRGRRHWSAGPLAAWRHRRCRPGSRPPGREHRVIHGAAKNSVRNATRQW